MIEVLKVTLKPQAFPYCGRVFVGTKIFHLHMWLQCKNTWPFETIHGMIGKGGLISLE